MIAEQPAKKIFSRKTVAYAPQIHAFPVQNNVP